MKLTEIHERLALMAAHDNLPAFDAGAMADCIIDEMASGSDIPETTEAIMLGTVAMLRRHVLSQAIDLQVAAAISQAIATSTL